MPAKEVPGPPAPSQSTSPKPPTQAPPVVSFVRPRNPLSSFFFLWIIPLIRIGRSGNVYLEDLKLGSRETAKVNGSLLEECWQQELQYPERPSIRRALIAAYAPRYLVLAIYKIFNIVFTYTAAFYLVGGFLRYIEEENSSPTVRGHLWALGLFLCTIGATVSIHRLLEGCTRIGVQVRAGLMALIYRKTLRLDTLTLTPSATVNLVSNECNRIAEACLHLHDLWSSFVECALAMALAMMVLSPIVVLPAFAVVLVVVLPLQWILAKKASCMSNAETRETTKRVHLMSEMVTAAKLVKFYCWENVFQERVSKVRMDEISYLRRALAARSVELAIVFSVPCLCMLTCLIMGRWLHKDGWKASEIFTTLCVFNAMRYPISVLPIAVKSTLAAVVCFDKLDDFMVQPEIAPVDPALKTIPQDLLEKDPKLRLVLDNASFQYEGSDKPVLSNLSLRVSVGEIVAIVGDVGAGKSSLLTALMQQIPLTSGSLHLSGRVSYVPHDAWLLNATIRENVLLASPPPVSQERYLASIKATSVEKDVRLLAYGDQTEVGERGTNLSLGQKQRVSLARAAYDPSEVVLLDDPLSVMDPRVGKKIFNDCLRGFMKDRAVVFVTNQLHYLRHCDRIIVLNDGRLVEEGTYEELMANDFDLATLVGDNIELEGPHDMDELAGELRRLDTIPTPSAASAVVPGALRPGDSTATASGQVGTETGISEAAPDLPTVDVPIVMTDANEINVTEEVSEPKASPVPETGPSQSQPPVTFSLPPDPRSPLPPTNVSEVSLTNTENSAVPEENHFARINERTLAKINESTITALIERSQLSVLSNPLAGLQVTEALHPSNREVDALAKAVEQNQLTIHSLRGVDLMNNPRSQSLSRIATGMSGAEDEMEEEAEEEDRLRGDGLWLRRRKRANEGPRPWRIYAKARYGWFPSVLGLLVFFSVHILRLGSDYLLSNPYRADKRSESPTTDYSLIGYSILVGCLLVGLGVRAILFGFVAVGKSIHFHDRMFKAVCKSQICFFEVVPLGRILNAFARHLYVVDESLSDAVLQALHFLPIAMGATLLAVILAPWAAIPAVIVGLSAWILVRYIRPAEEALKRLEAMSKPPIFAHLSASIEGLYSLRTYGIEGRFNAANLRRIDAAHKALLGYMMVKAWLALQLDLLACLFAYAVALVLIIQNPDGGTAGIVLTNALQLIIFMRWSARVIGDARVAAKSARELEWLGRSGTVPTERLDSEDDVDGQGGARAVQLPEGWPKEGKIEYKRVVLRYQRYGVAVLKNLSFVVKPREKVGIVGLTGSGKSTLLISLLRIVEPAEGEILIDDVDVRQLPLRQLRSSIAVIPSEPVLFVGSIRSNLDPRGICTDAEIWAALKAVHLSEKIHSMSMKLESDVMENGKTLSLGQRQLLCIARAMLLKVRILVVDDFASAIDVHTDMLIQDVLRVHFAQHTVLTIACRLNTIAARSDRIMVLNEGRVAEFASPLELLSDPNGLFYSLVQRSGTGALEKLRALTQEASSRAGSIVSETTEKRPLTTGPSPAVLVDSPSPTNAAAREPAASNVSVEPVLPRVPHDERKRRPSFKHMPRSLENVFMHPKSASAPTSPAVELKYSPLVHRDDTTIGTVSGPAFVSTDAVAVDPEIGTRSNVHLDEGGSTDALLK